MATNSAKTFKSDYKHPAPIRKRCSECNHKIGGPNHEEGEEHKFKKGGRVKVRKRK